MTKKSTALGIALLFILLTICNTEVYTNSSKPPLSRTGAPGESSTCAASGCHGGAANSGDGAVTIEVKEATFYQPGETYDITVTVEDEGKSRFGFEMVALSDNETSVGSFTAGDGSEVNEGNTGREYIHHRNAQNNNGGVFNMQWTAPDNFDEGDLTFYVAALAGNGNNNKSGDLVYTSSLVLPVVVVGIEDEVKPSLQINTYPNPTSDLLNVQYSLIEATSVQLSLYNTNGQLIEVLYQGTQAAGEHQLQSIMLDQYPKGMYLLELVSGEEVRTEKVFIF